MTFIALQLCCPDLFCMLANYHFRFSFHRQGLHSFVALLPLLGVSYIVGFFVEFRTAVAYMYILLNSTQVR